MLQSVSEKLSAPSRTNSKLHDPFAIEILRREADGQFEVTGVVPDPLAEEFPIDTDGFIVPWIYRRRVVLSVHPSMTKARSALRKLKHQQEKT